MTSPSLPDGLLDGLLDDRSALLTPEVGQVDLTAAVSRHLAVRADVQGEVVGPLAVPASRVEDLRVAAEILQAHRRDLGVTRPRR